MLNRKIPGSLFRRVKFYSPGIIFLQVQREFLKPGFHGNGLDVSIRVGRRTCTFFLSLESAQNTNCLHVKVHEHN